MNKFVVSALAFSLASSLSYAGSETEEWSSLDRDIENLASSFTTQGGSGFTTDGWIRGIYSNSSDILIGTEDLGGFSLLDVRAQFQGNVGDYGAFVSLEGSGGAASVLDAYGTFPIGDQVTGTFGYFRPPVLWSSSKVENNNLILLDRTFNSQRFYGRDKGVMISGAFEQVGWALAVQNGSDDVADELAVTGRVHFDALGTGSGHQEGAYGASEDNNLSVGLAYHDDGGQPSTVDGTAIAVDGNYTSGALSVHAEIVDYDNGFSPTQGLARTGGAVPGAPAVGGSETPWSVTVGFMVAPDEYEVALRFQDLDDFGDTNAITVGVTRYVEGHDAKWTLQFTTNDSDSVALDSDTVAVGLTVGV